MSFGGRRSTFAACGLLLAAAATAAPPGEAGGEMEAMVKEMQERTAAATTPGEQHQALARLLGDWDVDIVLGMPGMPKQTVKGKGRYEWLIEGRWLANRVEGELLGRPYIGFNIIGFDNYAKNHVVASVSSMDTALNVASGVVVDPAGKVTAVYGKLDEYTTGELAKPFKVVTRLTDDDHHTVEIWDLGIGSDGAKVLEFRYSRKKG